MDTQLWSTADVAPGLIDQPIKRIKTTRLQFPRGGTLVFVGVYFRAGNWLRLSSPKRVIILYNTPDPDRLLALISQVKKFSGIEPEVRFASDAIRLTVDVPGPTEISPFDAQAFEPRSKTLGTDFTVGRMSRDEDIKHHHEDAAVYKILLNAGVKIRIMGPSPRLREEMQGIDGIEMLDCGDESAPDFLQSLDCFFYRTNTSWDEPWGRVVVEAMAMGLPVVGHISGGYKALIETGSNGFLFNDTQEAPEIILRLKADPQRRVEIGAKARATIAASHGGAVLERLIASYL